jgi:hypothetical protein
LYVKHTRIQEAWNVEQIKVEVRYPAAEEPFKAEFAANTPLADVRSAAMTAFGLTEGQLPDGSTVTYPLYFHKERLDDLTQTLGQVVPGDARDAEFRLAQQVTQG